VKGIYILILKLSSEKNIGVGKLGRILFQSGYYAYIGSALSGIHRLDRHLNNIEKGGVQNPHWHIDYIVPHLKVVEWVFALTVKPGKEEEMANKLSGNLSYIPGFGSSDSSAPSHLFFARNLQKLKEEVNETCRVLGLNQIYAREFG
jgi:Uri superfamily endonuclease